MDGIIQPAHLAPGIHTLTIEAYHTGPGISKSKLWQLHTRTPFHARFAETASTEAQKFGNAAHTAVLEPNLFEPKYMRGPDDRRGNKWGAAQEIAQQSGKKCLTSGDYDDALRLRDALHRSPDIRKLTSGVPAIEQSAYITDEETGELVRCRPDIYSHDMRVMADLKATTDAGSFQFAKRCAEFGYNVQEAVYSDTWTKAGGGDVDAFLFIAVERKAPHAFCLYELTPYAAAEGHAIYRSALERWHACMEAERELRAERTGAPECRDLDEYLSPAWPMYGEGVQELALPRWSYKLTEASDD